MFKKVKVELPGFRSGVFFLRELSIGQTEQIATQDLNDVQLLTEMLRFSLMDESGERVINDNYSVDNLKDDLPARYMNMLAEKFTELNAASEESQIDIAKKS